jgi:hypothetical protein
MRLDQALVSLGNRFSENGGNQQRRETFRYYSQPLTLSMFVVINQMTRYVSTLR